MKKILVLKDKKNEEKFYINSNSFTIIYDNYKFKRCLPVNYFFNNEKGEYNLFFYNKKIDEYSFIESGIEVVSFNFEDKFVSKNNLENVLFYLKNNYLSLEEISNRVEEYDNISLVHNLLYNKNKNISYNNKIFLSLFMSILLKPNLLIIDNILTSLDKKHKDVIIEMLKKINNEGTTICYYTSNVNDLLFGSNIMVYDNDILIINDKVKSGLKKCSGIKCLPLPFVIDLSTKLKYYNQIKRINYSIEELVDYL